MPVVPHEDTMTLTVQSAEHERADMIQNKAPPTTVGTKPSKDTIHKLKQLHQVVSNETAVKVVDPQFNSLKRWVAINEQKKYIYLYHKPNIVDLKYNWVTEDNPHFKGNYVKPSKPLQYKQSIHDKPIAKATLDYVRHTSQQAMTTVVTKPIQSNMVTSSGRRQLATAIGPPSSKLDLFQRISPNTPSAGRRLEESKFNRDDALLCATASNEVYKASPSITGFTIKSEFTYEKSDTKIVTFHNSTTQVIAVRGTKSHTNWLTNMNFLTSPIDSGTIAIAGRAHGGYNAILATPEIWSYISNVIDGTPFDRRLLITGHSAGGGLSLLIRRKARAVLNLFTNCFVYTFGAPAVFDEPTGATYNQEFGSTTFRVYNPLDYVPYTPPNLFHTGTDVIIKDDLFMVNANGLNDTLNTVQALCSAIIAPVLVNTARNVNKFKQASTMVVNNVASPQTMAQSSAVDFEQAEREINGLRGVRIVDKDAMRLVNTQYQLENFFNLTITNEELAYRESIGSVQNYYQLRSRTVPSFSPITTSQTDVLRAIGPRIREEFRTGVRAIPAPLTNAIAQSRGQFPIPDAVYNAIGPITRVVPLAIFGYNLISTILREHTMDNYVRLITALAQNPVETSVWDNILNTIRSVAQVIIPIVTVPIGMNFGVGSGGYIPYVPTRTPDEQASLNNFNDEVSQMIAELDAKRAREREQDINNALDDLKSLTNFPQDGDIVTGGDDETCPVIHKEDVRGLIMYDASLHGRSDCSVVATIEI